MTREHADFYLGTGPDARWLGSLAEIGAPDQVARLDARAGHPTTTGVLSALDPDLYEAAVAALLDHQRATEVGFVAVPDTGHQMGWPWLAATSARWYAYTFTDQRVRASFRSGPLVHPRPRPPRRRRPDRDRPGRRAAHDRRYRAETATFTWKGFRGLPIPITQALPPAPQTYLTHRGEVALTLGRRRGARARPGAGPLADLNRAAIHKATLDLFAPGPAPNLYVLPEDAPFAYERVVAALDFLVDADRYAEGDNPTHGHELLASASSVAAQAVTAHRTHQPYPCPAR